MKIYESGMKLGRLTLIEKSRHGWIVNCQCGNEQYFSLSSISNTKNKGSNFECSLCKYKRRYPPLEGKVFGRLTVLKEMGFKDKKRIYLVRCECGIEKELKATCLTSKSRSIKSCGCLARKIASRWVNTTQYPPSHKLKSKDVSKIKIALYECRNAFVAACYNPKDSRYKIHGLKGHTVCDLWRNGAKDFVNWAIKNNYKIGYAITLKKNKTIFSPKNCIVILKKELVKVQNAVFVEYKGESKSISDWARKLGCTPAVLWHRLKNYKNFPMEKIMDLSFTKRKNKSMLCQ